MGRKIKTLFKKYFIVCKIMLTYFVHCPFNVTNFDVFPLLYTDLQDVSVSAMPGPCKLSASSPACPCSGAEAAARIPQGQCAVSCVTPCLGSGRSTGLRAVLSQPSGANRGVDTTSALPFLLGSRQPGRRRGRWGRLDPAAVQKEAGTGTRKLAGPGSHVPWTFCEPHPGGRNFK